MPKTRGRNVGNDLCVERAFAGPSSHLLKLYIRAIRTGRGGGDM